MKKNYPSPVRNYPTPAPAPSVPMGFSTQREVHANRAVKIKSKETERLEQEKIKREEYKKKFEENADKTIEYAANKEKRAIDTISKFLKLADDRTLNENKTSISLDVEREIRQELIQLCIDLNNDPTEEDEGKGSVIVASCLSKILLMYRDRINQLEFQLEKLKKP